MAAQTPKNNTIMANLEITQKLASIGKLKMVGEKQDYPVQNIYLDISNNGYPNHAQFQLAGTDRCSLALDLKEGDQVKVHFNIKGKSFDKKDGSGKGFFQNLEPWKISKIEEKPVGLPQGLSNVSQEGDDDLPF